MRAPYKVCLLAAGRGNRLSSAKILHKALLPVADKAIISHIIDRFPPDVEIVIAVGYKADQVKNFLSLAYPHRLIRIVLVDMWQGSGSGPGYSLLACEQYLQSPFVFTSIDTIVTEAVSPPTTNWIGVAPVNDSAPYLMAEVTGNRVSAFHDKTTKQDLQKQGISLHSLLPNAFIGMAGVHNFSDFWLSLHENKGHLVDGEVQVAAGLKGLIARDLHTIPFTWFDTGTDTALEETRQTFTRSVVAPKTAEQLYIQNDIVIKFFAEEGIADRRVARAQKLRAVVPAIIDRAGNFYSYRKVPGQLLSEVPNVRVFESFLEFCLEKIWQPLTLSVEARADFVTRCDTFYRTKTMERLTQFYRTTDIKDKPIHINGLPIPSLTDLLQRVPWSELKHGTPVLFHGDLQPENVIVRKRGAFTLIDWRQDFAGLLDYGDIYYDFAKLDHALLINANVIRQDLFDVQLQDDHVHLQYHARSHLLEFRRVLHDFIDEQGYSVSRVKLLSALIYLNIAPLHHSLYNVFLYYLGQYLLAAELNHYAPSLPHVNRSKARIAPAALRH